MTANVFPAGADKAYGGERIVLYLIEALSKLGHEIVLFAPVQWTVPARWLYDRVTVPAWGYATDPYTTAALDWEERTGEKLDVFHCNYFGEVWDRSVVDRWPYVELVWCDWCHTQNQLGGRAFNTVSYSKTMHDAMARSGRESICIPYGIPLDRYGSVEEPDDYVVWIGKLEGGKGAEWAIDCARAAGRKIVIMGPPYNPTHVVNDLLPRFGSDVIWLRGVTDTMKADVFRNAAAFLSANVDGWQEMMGITNLEALASGCPVIGWTKGGTDASAVLHDGLIEDGVNGFLVHYESSAKQWDAKVAEVAEILKTKIDTIDRKACRESVAGYDAGIMAARWTKLYEAVQGKKRHHTLVIE